MTGSGSFWPCCVNTVAFSLTPSRAGTFTPHCMSMPGSPAAVFCCAVVATPPNKIASAIPEAAVQTCFNITPSISFPPHCDGLLCSRSEEHTSELQSPYDLVCRLLLEKKKTYTNNLQ